MGRKQIKCHGDDIRFEIMAKFIYERYGRSIKYIADVAGGQGLLTRILNKSYSYHSEVIDPRGFTLKGVPSRQCEYNAEMASFYDLIIGLHPDEATRPVVESAMDRPVIVIPCCNFWDRSQKLSSRALVHEISHYFEEQNIQYETVNFNLKGPNIGLITH